MIIADNNRLKKYDRRRVQARGLHPTPYASGIPAEDELRGQHILPWRRHVHVVTAMRERTAEVVGHATASCVAFASSAARSRRQDSIPDSWM